MLKRTIILATTLFLASLFFQLEAAPNKNQPNLSLDLTFKKEGSATLFTATKGTVAQINEALEYTFQKGSSLTSPSFDNSRNGIYNPTLEIRNTMFFIMENRSSAKKLKLSFITADDKVYDDLKSKTFNIQSNSPKSAYYFNLSNNPKAKGRLMGLRIEPLDGSGKIIIDRITFEQETKLEPFAGEITACRASNKNITVKGHITPEYQNKFSRIAIYETSMLLKTDDISQMSKLYETPITSEFIITKIPIQKGKTTRLSSQFLAVVEDNNGNSVKIAPRFYIENWRDFENNPYSFRLPKRTVSVLDYGAKGDGFTDDTDAIQAAINDVSAKGGGHVVLRSDNSFYGKRYIATNIMMKSNVDLHLEKGAILWQSQDEGNYKYKPAYGHEGVIPGINWTHNMHVSNLPLIQCKEIENVKITGPGKIRSADVESTDEQFAEGDYRRYCNDRIHVIPIGMWKVKNIEVSDVELVRTNNYHTAFYGCENIFIGNV
ncbi:MAG: glycosyl hydrolase family 28-related protein, partial [Bacteroidota bacterium]|nr:glycosyl hydrolase family 28-related protein [Bacteroidota bacterium]